MRALGPAVVLSAVVHGGVLATLLMWPTTKVDDPAPVIIELIVPTTVARPAGVPAIAPATSTPAIEPAPSPPTAAPAPVGASPATDAAVEPSPAAVVERAEAEPLRPNRKPRVPKPPAPPVAEANTAPGIAGEGPPSAGPPAQSPVPARTAALVAAIAGPGTAAQDATPEGDNPRPVYPPRARRQGLEGRVILDVEVGPGGAALAVYVRQSSGHALLDRAAQAAVEQWRFQPARRGGRAVAGSTEVTVRFVLTE